MVKKKTTVSEIEEGVEVFPHILLRGPLLHDGDVYKVGDVVNLTDAQVAALPAGMVAAESAESSTGDTEGDADVL